MPFDICLAFDCIEYLNPQIYLFADSIKGKIPEDTTVHIVTNREDNDEPLQYLIKSIDKIKIYHNDTYPDLESRCRYMLNAMKIETDREWVMKAELDLLFLKPLSLYNELLKEDLDIVIESENRKIFSDDEEKRLWRILYKVMNIKMPNFKIQYRENNEIGLPLFGTGLFFIKSHLLPIFNKRWELLTRMVEPWGPWGIHPNEFAATAMILDEMWKWEIYKPKWKYNPIAFWRDGEFPSTKLRDNCIMPEDVVCLDYHHLNWLNHICKYNPRIKDMISKERLESLNDDSTCKSKDGF